MTKKIGKPFDGFNIEVIPSGSLEYGEIELTKGSHQLRFQVNEKIPTLPTSSWVSIV